MTRAWPRTLALIAVALAAACGGADGDSCDAPTGSLLVVRPIDDAGNPVTVDAIEWLDGGGTFECAGGDPSNCQYYFAEWLPDMFMGILQITHCGVITQVEITSEPYDCTWQADLKMKIGTCVVAPGSTEE